MAAVSRKDYRLGIRINWTGLRLEPAKEEFVERFESLCVLNEFRVVEFIFLDEGSDSLRADWTVHPPAVPAGEEGTFGQSVQGDFPEQSPISPPHEGLAIDFLYFDLAGISVEKLNL